ncbi:MAG TPA: hypothetical protein VMO76_02265 [Candidatus Udaeobacter sp.]|jgi:hypothetical protein|nr:hypothetical protein [Candidatus Udaeobacter sp.]
MMKSLLLGAIFGGIAAFIWSTISWTVLPWHEKPMLHFQNEDEVTAVISSHAPQSGMYILPASPSQEGMTAEQKKVAQATVMEKMHKGPIMFAAVRRGGFGSYARGLIIQLLSLMAAALLLTWLLLQTSGLSYRRGVLFVGVVGLAASVIVNLPDWNWWGFSGVYTFVNLADFTLMWLFAGLVIAKVANPQASSAGR